LWALKQHRAAPTLFARDTAKAESVAKDFDVQCKNLSGATYNDFDVVVNATPLGTNGARSAETPAVASQLAGARLAYDLVYNPAETRFLREARVAGCDGIGGLAMLVSQAFEQFRLWTGIEPPRKVMRDSAVKALSHG
jgi:shikimate 5-dehydrogenase